MSFSHQLVYLFSHLWSFYFLVVFNLCSDLSLISTSSLCRWVKQELLWRCVSFAQSCLCVDRITHTNLCNTQTAAVCEKMKQSWALQLWSHKRECREVHGVLSLIIWLLKCGVCNFWILWACQSIYHRIHLWTAANENHQFSLVSSCVGLWATVQSFQFHYSRTFRLFSPGCTPLVFRFDYLRLCEKKNLINFMQSWS